MTDDPLHAETVVASDAADHIDEARQRARQVLGAEAHIGAVDDWRRTLVGARDALIGTWLLWIALQGFGNPPHTGFLLVAMAIAAALLVGISTGRATHSQIDYYAAELERERTEIREHYEHECDEVRALYAAKGFRDPLLSQIVDTLSADDDRLLKVMMEEELGLSMHHVQHPLIVGLFNFAAAAVAGLVLSVPVVWLPEDAARLWILIGGPILLLIVSLISGRATGRGAFEFFTVAVLMAIATGGVAYYLAKWFSGLLSVSFQG